MRSAKGSLDFGGGGRWMPMVWRNRFRRLGLDILMRVYSIADCVLKLWRRMNWYFVVRYNGRGWMRGEEFAI